MLFMPSIKKHVSGKAILISTEDEYMFNSHNWYLVKARQIQEKYYISTSINKRTVYLHRIISKAIKGEVVDHVNRDTLDCTRENLRIVTSSFNRLNSSVSSNKKGSQFKGVFYKKNRVRPYYSLLRVANKKAIYLGSFKTEYEAADAYNSKMFELYGIAV